MDIPSILISLRAGPIFSQLGLQVHWATSRYGAQLSWSQPFGLMAMFAVFNRFYRSYAEAARDEGATAWETIHHVVPPIIAPWFIGAALFGYTLSVEGVARTLLAAGSHNTLPLEVYGMTANVTIQAILALGNRTTAFSLLGNARRSRPGPAIGGWRSHEGRRKSSGARTARRRCHRRSISCAGRARHRHQLLR